MKRKHRAIVEKYKPTRVADIRTNTRARLPCGCVILVGIGFDTEDGKFAPTTRSQACCEQHQLLVERADNLLREWAARPVGNRMMVAVCADALSAAARELI